MVKRAVIDKGVQFDTNINVVEDFDFVIQAHFKGFTFDFVDRQLVNVHHLDGERNFNYQRGVEARDYLYEKYYSYLKERPLLRYHFLFKTCVFSVLTGGPAHVYKSVVDFREKFPVSYGILKVAKISRQPFLKKAAVRAARIMFKFAGSFLR
jgi:hypothetical protein